MTEWIRERDLDSAAVCKSVYCGDDNDGRHSIMRCAGKTFAAYFQADNKTKKKQMRKKRFRFSDTHLYPGYPAD